MADLNVIVHKWRIQFKDFIGKLQHGPCGILVLFSGIRDSEIRKLFLLPYCFRSSWSSFNCFISSFISAIVASRSAKLALRLRISVCSVDRLSRRSLLVDLMIQANLSDILWSSSASSNASLKRASCSTGSREESLCLLLLCWPRLPIVQGIEDTGTAQESSGAINSFQSYWEQSKFQTDKISDINIHPWYHLLESIWSWVIHNEVVHFPELCRAYTWGNWEYHQEPMTAASMPPQRSEVLEVDVTVLASLVALWAVFPDNLRGHQQLRGRYNPVTMTTWLFSEYTTSMSLSRLRWMCCCFGGIFVAGCTGDCLFDNIRCSRRRRLRQNRHPFVLWLTSELFMSSLILITE